MGSMRVVQGGGGVPIAVAEWGCSEGPPILLIHGYCQSHLTWRRQFEGPLAREFRLVALDLRGHGSSGSPAAEADFADGRYWAADIEAVIRELGLGRPVLVGWSYGGFVLADFVRYCGQQHAAGLCFVGALPRLGDEAAGKLIGPGFWESARGLVSEDLHQRIEATRSFVRRLTREPLPAEEFERTLAFNMVVSPAVRRAVVTRRVNNDDVFAALEIPTLVSHGRHDQHALLASGEHIAARVPGARLSVYEEVAHAPFWEDPERFDRELAAFVRAAIR
jgi:non-heme chloroperoxidase